MSSSTHCSYVSSHVHSFRYRYHYHLTVTKFTPNTNRQYNTIIPNGCIFISFNFIYNFNSYGWFQLYTTNNIIISCSDYFYDIREWFLSLCDTWLMTPHLPLGQGVWLLIFVTNTMESYPSTSLVAVIYYRIFNPFIWKSVPSFSIHCLRQNRLASPP